MKDKKNKVEKPKQKEEENTTEEHVPGGGIKTKPPKDE